MTKEYMAKILEILAGTAEESVGHISDAYVRFEINKMKFWSFMHEWRTYFPYWKEDRWATDTYLQELTGKKIKLKLCFCGFKIQKNHGNKKTLAPIENRKKPCDYYLYGEIISKKEHSEKISVEIIEVDCGVIVKSSLMKPNDFKVGDFVKIEGRLDAFFTEDPKNLISYV